ncbi:KRAB-A domain-containing protein 2 [Araneus ventricosus]|uniref:KRAB-A domain-containing protein 2 n=1 Tax=Araneus ventricosus TaxID=182803 RepID=A0A4Y2EIP8_ARAVE|nr:KRAB-A domain-containing protein 2 [Araneus ventricosus]
MNYQNHATKFCLRRPLKTKRADEVAMELLKVFLDFNAPHIFQSDNSREFIGNVMNELLVMWPDCKIVHGRPRHPQSQGSVERCNQDIANMLRAWMD